MAYLSADSGNLMAIAEQVIQQQQQRRQQQQQHQHQQQQQQQHQLAPSLNPFSTNPSTWGSNGHFVEHLPFVIPEPDPFAADSVTAFGAPSGTQLDHIPFRLSDFGSSAAAPAAEFDSDDWMESLIGESHAESSQLMTDTLFADPAFASDLNTVLFSSKIAHFPPPPLAPAPPAPPQSLTFDPPPPKDAPAPSPERPLLKSLLRCARLAESDPDLAAKTLSQIKASTSDVGDPVERVAFYFAVALHRRLSPPSHSEPSPEDFTVCYKTLNEACPYSKFAHLTANQAILEATESAPKIHIIDFGTVQGVQWAALLQALATRPAGKPSKVRISGIPAPALGSSPAASLVATGNRLRDFAALLDLDFEFEPVLAPVQDINESTFRVKPDETIAVNFMLQLYNVLDDSTEPVERILGLARSLAPRVVTLGEYEVSLNRAGFVERFGAGMAYYVAVFESLEPAMDRESSDRVQLERLLFGHRILRTVGPDDGPNGRLRMECKDEWRAVMERCGFEAVAVSNYAVSQAKLLLWNYNYSSKYGLLDSPPGFLSLAWGDRPLITVSSWRSFN